MMNNFTSNNNANFYWWFGVVEDRNDPLRLGRCRIRILGYHTDDKEELATDDLPWAIPVMPSNSASTSGVGWSPTGAVEGSWCVGFFADGEDGQHPMYFGTVGAIPGGLAGTGCGDGSGGSGQPGDSATSDGATPEQIEGLTPAQASQIAIDVVKWFMSKGWNKAQACGFVGNFQVECGNFNPNVIMGSRRGDSGNAAGVAQWNRQYSRDRVANFRRIVGIDLFAPGNIDWRTFLYKQLDFVLWELANTHKPAARLVRQQPNTKQGAAEAAKWVDKKYEISDQKSTAQRQRNAMNLFDRVQ